MKMSETIAELAIALSKAQGQIEDATKDGINPAFKSKYADLAAYRAVIREPLAVNDLAIMQLPRTRPGYVEVETILLHKSGEFVSETLEIPVTKFDAHGIGSGITYARRYGLMAVLCLASVDDDGNAAVEPKPAARKTEISQEEAGTLKRALVMAAGMGRNELNTAWSRLTQEQRALFDKETVDKLKEIAAAANAKKKDDE